MELFGREVMPQFRSGEERTNPVRVRLEGAAG